MDILNELRKRFKCLLEEAKAEANKILEDFLDKIDYDSLSIRDKILSLCAQIEQFDKEIEEFPKREYSDYYKDDIWLFNCYMHQYLVYGNDDSEHIGQGVFFGICRNKLIELVRELRKDYPQYTYDDFINGKEEVLFYYFADDSPVVSHEEYLKIHFWQNKQNLKITEHERLLMQAIFREHCKGIDHIAKITEEKKTLNEIYSFDPEGPEDEFVEYFKRLVVLKDYDFASIDCKVWKSAFEHFKKDKYLVSCRVPETLNPLLEKYESGTVTTPISPLSLLFYSLARYERWLDGILDDRISIEDDWIIKYEEEVQAAIDEGKRSAAKYERTFLDRTVHLRQSSLPQSKKTYLKDLFSQADELRALLKSEAHLLYFAYAEDIDRLALVFQHQCCKESCLEKEKLVLKEALELFEKVAFINSEIRKNINKLNKVRKGIPNEFCPDSVFYRRVVFLESDLLKKYKKLNDDLWQQRWINKYPYIFRLMNFHEGLNEILNDAYNKVRDVLEEQQQNNKIIYIQKKLKDLRHRELDANRFNLQVGKFHREFERLLEIEAEFVKETKDVDMMPAFKELKALPELKQPSEPEEQAECKKSFFDYRGESDQLLRKIYKGLNTMIELVNEEETNEDEFVAVFQVMDLAKIKTPIHFGCGNAPACYVLDKMRHLFKVKHYLKGFSFVNIERSQLFYSKDGTPLTASNISKSKANYFPKKQNVDKFFRELN